VLLVLAATAALNLASPVAASAARVYAFGLNLGGQLGNTTNAGTTEPNPTPAEVALAEESREVAAAAAGSSHSLVLTRAGILYAFGENQFGQLANSLNLEHTTPDTTPTRVQLPRGSGRVTKIAAGTYQSLVLTSSGRLYSFGTNLYGQLGAPLNAGTESPNPQPTRVELPPTAGVPIELAVGGEHDLVLTSTGRVYSFGYNYQGQLGYTTNEGTQSPNSTPTRVTLPGETGVVVQVSAGAYTSFVLTSTGQLFAFGDNYWGQLGRTGNVYTDEPNPPALVSLPGGSGRAIAVAAGGYHTLVLTDSGQLYGFGWNFYGQLGAAVAEGENEAHPSPTRIELPAEAGRVSAITASNSDSYVLTTSGLYGFGSDLYGQLGFSGAEKNPPTPVPAPAGEHYVQVGAGSVGEQTLALAVP
jgi:alpha-tubulin suppressor-like RCC1 family protein